MTVGKILLRVPLLLGFSLGMAAACAADRDAPGFDRLRGGGRAVEEEGGAGTQRPSNDAGPCKRGGEACAAYSECCTRTCTSSRCTACMEAGETCSAGTPCCTGTCFHGTCRNDCAGDFGSCVGSADCCSQICEQGLCMPCQSAGESCWDGAAGRCCGGLTCGSDAADGGAGIGSTCR